MAYDGPSGRLELTWTNKHLRLIDQLDGSYEWVDPSDWRVAEVRLLRDRATVGKVAPDEERAEDDLVIRGDALAALKSLTDLPEFADTYAGKVRLVYIDPPFNTGQTFDHYEDALDHSVWLTMFRDRLLQIKRLLAPNGSVWVHLDDTEVHRARCVMDEVFGAANFVASVTWVRRNDPRNTARFLSGDHDSVLVYGLDVSQLTTNQLPRTDKMDAAYTNPDDDERGPWRRGDLAARNYYSKGTYPITTPSGRRIQGPPSGSFWRVSEEELWRLHEEGRIYWGIDGDSRPYLKRYLTEVQTGRVVSSVWPPEEVGFVRNGKEEVRAIVGDVFATPKPERLMERILHIGSDPGDIVVDCFGGSGTTAAVALKMGRRFVTVEREADTVDTFLVPRLTRVVDGADPGGVTEQHDWQGGGGFRVLDVASSMFEAEDGETFLADWATDGELAEATAAQLGFDHDPDDGPFVGHRGRVRLAVVDGLVNAPVLEALAAQLPADASMLVAGTAVVPDAEAVARDLVKGARVRKIPAAILTRYRRQALA